MFGKKILTKVFAGLLFISLLISTFIPQLAFAADEVWSINWIKHSPNKDLDIESKLDNVVLVKKGNQLLIWSGAELIEEEKSYIRTNLPNEVTPDKSSIHWRYGDGVITGTGSNDFDNKIVIGNGYVRFNNEDNWSLVFWGKLEKILPEPEPIEISVSKIWNDGNNQDGKRPCSVTIKLFANGGDTGKILVLSKKNNWTGTFNDLDEYSEGNLIVYTVQEVMVGQGYSEPSITGTATTGFTVTNSRTPETITVSGEKTWNDQNNQDNVRPTSIVIRLRKNNEVFASKTVTADDDWAWSFEDLDKYSNGKKINYTITEDKIRNYKTTVYGFNVTNSYVPGKTSVDVSKVWEDDDNLNNLRPPSVTIKLLADEVDTGKRLVLSKENNWAETFNNLDVAKEGNPIVYKVEEEAVPKYYDASVDGNATEGYVVTNTLIKQTVGVTIQGLKSLTGRELKDEEFIFELYQQILDPIPQISVLSLSSDKPVQTTTNIGENWSFNLSFDGPGEYEYISREQQGNLPGVIYDQSEYSVYISVYFNNDGELVAELFGVDEKPISGDDLVFRNSYNSPPPPPPTTPIPDLEVEKLVAESVFSEVGDELHYLVRITNTGDLAFVKLIINDARLGIANLKLDLSANPLEPKETYSYTFEAPYVVTQADVDAREAIVNIVTVEGETAEGLTADDEDDVTVGFEQTGPHIPPVISVEKLVKEKNFTKAGDKLHYSFTVKNEGIEAIVKLTVNDSLLEIEDLAIDLTDDPLMPGESFTYEFSEAYVVTEADLNAGKVVNVLAVTAESVEGAKSEAEADVTTPWEQVSPQTPDLPQTGEYTGYRAGIYSLLLGGAVVLVAINRRKKISYQSDNAD